MRNRLTLQDAQNLAIKKEGRCLSEKYINSKASLLWQCNKMHPPWESAFRSIQTGSWCPTCVRERTAFSIDYARKLAIEKGGRCLSTEYVNSKLPLTWQCDAMHPPWTTTLSAIKHSGNWCPKCSVVKQSHTIEFARQVALNKNGRCLSETYENNHTPLSWQCQHNHQPWMARLNDILNDHWCPKCGYLSYTLSIEVAREIASSRGGKCLSDVYTGIMAPLLWQCEKLHDPWYASLNSIKNHNSWCPSCRQSRGEELIASLLTIRFNREYSASNINPSTSGKLRYDFYIPSTKWIIEFDGAQHFETIPYFANSKSLEDRQELDRLKTNNALKAGHSVLRIYYDDIQIADKLINIVYRKSDGPCLYLSRVGVYNYLNTDPLICTVVFDAATGKTIDDPPKFLTLNIIKS